MHVVVLAGHGQRDLALEVEMLLAADAHPAGEPARAAASAALASPRCSVSGSVTRTPRRQRRVDVEDRPAAPRTRPSASLAARRACVAGLGGDGEQRLADVLDDVVGEHRLVVAVDRADVVVAGDVGGGQHADHARRRAHRRDVDAVIRACASVADAELDVQQARRARACRRCRAPRR